MPPQIDHLLVTPCTLVTRWSGPASQADEYGDRVEDEVLVPGSCLLQQQQSMEDGNTQVSRWRVFLSPQHQMTGWDAIVVDGERYTLEGDCYPVLDPLTRAVHHVEAVVQRTR